MRLNLTFYEIYFSYNVKQCYLGKLEIISYASRRIAHNHILCGQYPLVRIYPTTSTITVVLKLPPKDPLYTVLRFNFSVTDCDIVVSKPIKGFPATFNMISVQKLPPLKTMQYTFLLQVEQYKRLCINVNRTKHLALRIHDGPGLDSPILLGGANQTIATGFQCFMILFTRYTCPLEVNFISMQKNFDFSINLSKDNKSVKEFKSKGLDLFTTAKLRTHSGYYINVTVDKILYNGPYSDTCMFGGFSLHDQKGLTDISRAYSLCHDERHLLKRLIQKQNMYSTNETFIAVGFSYREYSSIYLNLSLSCTKCPAVTLDPCTLNRLCINNISATLCQNYLALINVFPNFDLDLNTLQSAESKYPHAVWPYIPIRNTNLKLVFIFSLQYNSCGTIQIYRNKTDSALHRAVDCGLFFVPQPLQTHGVTIVYQVSLFSTQFYRRKNWQPVSSPFRSLGTDEMDLLGPNSATDKIHSKIGQMETYVLVSRTPIHGFSLAFYTVLQHWSLTWMDISVWWNDTSVNSRLRLSVFPCTAKAYHINQHKKYFPVKYYGQSGTTLKLVFLQTKDKHNNFYVCASVSMTNMFFLSKYKNQVSNRFAAEASCAVRQYNHLVFSKLSDKHMFSVQGTFSHVTIQQTSSNSSHGNLCASWMKHKPMQPMQNETVEKCTDVSHIHFDVSSSCFQIEIGQNFPMKKYLFFRGCYNNGQLSLRSWKEAQSLCTDMAEYLLFFHGDRQLQAFLSFLQTTTEIIQSEAVYIGVRSSNFVGVSKTW